MRKFAKLAAAVATSGIAVFGSFAASGGVANAAPTQQSVTGCSSNSGLLGVGLFPTCTATDSTVVSPTSLTVNITGNLLSVLGTIIPGIGEKVTFNLSCSVGGSTVTVPESFTSTDPNDTSETLSLQAEVGSPAPNNCTIQGLQVKSTLALNLLSLLQTFTFGANVTAGTGLPGAIYMNSGKTSAGASASTCVDIANNGNVGAKVQAYGCNSDLAQSWVQTNTDQLVRNGVCLTQNSKNATLAKCSPTNNAQKWDVNGTGGQFATFVNHSTGQCLTAASPKNFTQITVVNCANNAADQKWTAPANSPV